MRHLRRWITSALCRENARVTPLFVDFAPFLPPRKKQVRKQYLKNQAIIEEKNSKRNLNEIQESWLKIMRTAKIKQLKKEVCFLD